MKTLKHLIKLILLNGLLLWGAYEYLISNNENIGNIFLLYTWAMAFWVIILNVTVVKKKNDNSLIEKIKQTPLMFPTWLIMLPDLAIIIALAYYGKILIAVVWIWNSIWQISLRESIKKLKSK